MPSFRSMRRMMPGLESLRITPLPADGYQEGRPNHWLDSLCFMLTVSSPLILSVFRLTEHQFLVQGKKILRKTSRAEDEQEEEEHAVWQVPLAHMVNATSSH